MKNKVFTIIAKSLQMATLSAIKFEFFEIKTNQIEVNDLSHIYA